MAAKSHQSDGSRLATDRRAVQDLLRSGLAAATVVMGAGIVIKAAHGDWSSPTVRLFDLGKSGLSPGDRLMGLGILLLAATPAFRVIALVILWTRERDWRFVATAAIVVVTLGIAISVGGG